MKKLVMRLESFREVESTLNIPASTFGDALRERSYGFFKELCDLILYDGPYTPIKEKPVELRHGIYRDPLTKKIFHFITSDFKSSAKTIAGIYKRRWAVGHSYRLDTKDPCRKRPSARLSLESESLGESYVMTYWEIFRSGLESIQAKKIHYQMAVDLQILQN